MAEEIKNALCGLCINHCLLEVRVRNGEFVGVDSLGAKDSPAAKRRGQIVRGCVKAVAAREYFYHPARLNYPLKRVGERGQNGWQRISWEQALDEIAGKLDKIRDDCGPEAVAIAATGELNVADEYRARFQYLFGTPNHIGVNHICFGAAMTMSLILTGSIVRQSPIRTETRCLMLLGSNPAQSSLPLWHQILQAKKGGLKLIVIDPRGTEAARMADIWLQPKPGTDAVLLLGMVHTIIAEGLYDRDFVDGYCHGFDELWERVKGYSPEKASEVSKVPAASIREAARIYATSKPAVTYGRPLEQIPNSVQAIHARYILPAITGNLDIRGGDMMNLPHPSVVLGGETSLFGRLPQEQREKMIAGESKLLTWPVFGSIAENLKKVTARPANPIWLLCAHAPSIFRAMITGKPYPVKGMITQSQNPLVGYANTKLVYEAIKTLDLHVAMDIFMTPSCQLADYVLPAASCFEKPILFGGDYDASIVGGVAALSPQYERRTEYYLWRELGKRLGQEDHWPWETLEGAYDHRLAPMGVNFQEFVERGGIDIARHEYKEYERFGFGTATGKCELYSTVLEELGYDPLPSYQEPPRIQPKSSEMSEKYPLTLITGGRTLPYHHSGSRQVKSVRKKAPDPIAQVNPSKASELGIMDGDWVWIETPLGRSKHKCRHFNGVNPDVVHAEHGWWFPEESGEDPSLFGLWHSNINVVVDDDPDLCDPVSGAWALKGLMCKVYRAENEARL
ncbi:molybdopterin-dependent oxidoreductase [Chloroflexota bacterium]